jgi:hypothetical protein
MRANIPLARICFPGRVALESDSQHFRCRTYRNRARSIRSPDTVDIAKRLWFTILGCLSLLELLQQLLKHRAQSLNSKAAY